MDGAARWGEGASETGPGNLLFYVEPASQHPNQAAAPDQQCNCSPVSRCPSRDGQRAFRAAEQTHAPPRPVTPEHRVGEFSRLSNGWGGLCCRKMTFHFSRRWGGGGKGLWIPGRMKRKEPEGSPPPGRNLKRHFLRSPKSPH